MNKQEILDILKNYGINDYGEKKEIDTSNGDDYRLAERYREMGLLAPKLYKTVAGKYISKHNQYVCYISEYIDLPSLEEKEDKLA